MASLRKLKGKWYVRIRYNGKDKIIPTYTSIRRDAEITLRKYQENEQEVKLRLANHLLDASVTIESCIKFFKANYKAEMGITESTSMFYNVSLQDFRDCFKPKTCMCDLKKRDYSQLVIYLKSRYSDTTVNIRLRGNRAFLNYLLEKDFIKSLPFNIKQIKIDKAPPKMITPEELSKIYRQVDNPMLLSAYKVLEVTGMRVGELINSRRDGEFIIVEKSKARRKRYIPIPVEYIQDYETAKEMGFSVDRLSVSFTRASKRAGYDGKTCHHLRHTFAYRKLLETDNIQLVRDLLGHSTTAMTETYTEIPIDYLKQIFKDKGINTQNTYKTVGNA